MTTSHPLIGMPMQQPYNGRPEMLVGAAYCRAIEAAGGVPLPIPLSDEPWVVERFYGMIDGLFLCGGGDIAARFYGAIDSGALTAIDEPRDRLELTLTGRALHDGLPIYGICRGVQTLNVAAGGTLFQDIPTDFPEALDHRASTGKPLSHVAHAVRVEPGSLLSDVLGDGPNAGRSSVQVNSFHHQAVRDVAPGFRVNAWSPDGVVEGIEWVDGDAHVLGVQWHPERMVPQREDMVRLFSRFVDACRSR